MFSTSRVALIRRSAITFTVILLLAPLLAWSSLKCVDTMFNTPHLWIPATDQERTEFDWFVEHFESPALVIISWPGCTVDDPRLARFEDALLDPGAELYRAPHAEFVDHAISGRSVLRQLMDDPLNLSREAAIERLQGVLVGADGAASCAVVTLTDRGGYERTAAVHAILDTAEAACRLGRDAFRLGGPPVDGVAIDRAGIDTMKYFALPSALLALLMCWWCLRAWRYAIAVMAAAAFGEGVCLALVFLSGKPMNAILILMPPLVLVLTIAAGVHLVNYYFDEARLNGIREAPQRAMQTGWLPSVLATTTTGIGLGSLLVSQVDPIRMFGGFATVGVFMTLLTLFLLLPGAMERWPIDPATQAATNNRARRMWLRLANRVVRRSEWIGIAAVIAMAALGWGLQAIETSVKLRDLFSPRDRLLADYTWLEETLGPMVPVEVVVHFPADSRLDFRRQINFVREIASQVEELDEAQAVMSAATFAAPFPRGRGARQVILRTVVTKRLTEARYLDHDDQWRSWRIMARVPALTDLDYAQFLQKLEVQIAPLIESASKQLDEPVRITITGALPLIYRTQRTLLADLIESFVAAFGVVAVMMMIVLRSVRAGLLVMIPNCFPTAVVFGLMGWLDVPIDIGSVMTASIALGIAVVDSLHFLTWFQREVSAGHTAQHAVRKAYLHCATPMLQTSIICGLGMLVFVLSSFTPASRFAWMVFALLMAALLGDLVILPAILAGPLGKVFVRHRPASREGEVLT